MAERRMFAKTIIDSDAFLDMPASTQNLYFHLSMRADDDGFINNAKKIQRVIGGSDDDLKLLIAKKFIIPFESGIVVIKHWRIHNYIRRDCYNETKYKEEKSTLSLDENEAYTLNCNDSVTLPSRSCDDTVDGSLTQVRIGKVRLGKDSIYCAVVDHLNAKATTMYRATSAATQRHIGARVAEGYTLDDFISVIDKKCAEWTGTDMEKYLRPETLFGTKFESYLNSKTTDKRPDYTNPDIYKGIKESDDFV